MGSTSVPRGSGRLFLATISSRHLPSAVGLGCILAAVQIFLFRAPSKPAPDLRERTRLEVGRERALLAIGVILALAFYVSLVFPRLPVEFGGGLVYDVKLFCKTPNLVSSYYSDNMNKSRNPFLDSYLVHVLYESDSDFYLLEQRTLNHQISGYTVMRIPKAEILRVDYDAPKWIHLGGSPP